MSILEGRLFVCGARELVKSSAITHLLTITNPGVPANKPSWFHGEHLQLWFGDVVSEADAKQCRTKAPTIPDIEQALGFLRQAWSLSKSRILISCDYGASRSAALAYVFAADCLGAGREQEALDLILKIRPEAVPNKMVVELGDMVLKRGGALLGPVKKLYSQINAEIEKWHI
jgi:predicted protein tyrosine phosphatase